MATRKYNRTKECPSLPERLMGKVEMVTESGCWIWMGYVNPKGYGIIGVRRGVDDWPARLAHRVSFELFRHSIPEELELDHLCRVRCCVNPYHLEPVTSAENTRRGIGPPRYKAWAKQRAKTHCPYGHEYTPENTAIYGGGRFCKACSHNRAVENAKRKKEHRHLVRLQAQNLIPHSFPSGEV